MEVTYPSSQVFGDQRHQQAGRGHQRASRWNKVHLHETHLAVVASQSQRVHAGAHALQTQPQQTFSWDVNAGRVTQKQTESCSQWWSNLSWSCTPWHSVWGIDTGWGCWCQKTASAGCSPPWRWAPPFCMRRHKCTRSRRRKAGCAPAGWLKNTNKH